MRAAAFRACCEQDVKHHPASVDLELIKRLLANDQVQAHAAGSSSCQGVLQHLQGVRGWRAALLPQNSVRQWTPAACIVRRHLFQQSADVKHTQERQVRPESVSSPARGGWRCQGRVCKGEGCQFWPYRLIWQGGLIAEMRGGVDG